MIINFMAEQYLRCKYYEDSPMMTFSKEYLVTFKIRGNKQNPSVLMACQGGRIEFPAKDEDWCIVDKNNVLEQTKEKGLVELVGLRMDEVKDEAFVKISNIDGISYFSVPIEEIEVR